MLKRAVEERGYTDGLRGVQEYLQQLCTFARPNSLVRFETDPGHQMQMDCNEFRKPELKLGMLAAFVTTFGYSRFRYAGFVSDMASERCWLAK